jgi:hypothetical protein
MRVKIDKGALWIMKPIDNGRLFRNSNALLKTNGSLPERSEGSPILPQILRFAQNDYGLFWHVFNRAEL